MSQCLLQKQKLCQGRTAYSRSNLASYESFGSSQWLSLGSEAWYPKRTPGVFQNSGLRFPSPTSSLQHHGTSKAFPPRKEVNPVRRGLRLPAAFQGPPLEGAHSSVRADAPEHSSSGPQPLARRKFMVARQFGLACLSQLSDDFPEKNGSLLRGLERVRVSLPPAWLDGALALPSPLPASSPGSGGIHVHPTFFLFLLQPTFSSLCRQSSREGPGQTEKPETAGRGSQGLQ